MNIYPKEGFMGQAYQVEINDKYFMVIKNVDFLEIWESNENCELLERLHEDIITFKHAFNWVEKYVAV